MNLVIIPPSSMEAHIGSLAMVCCEPRQVRKEAAVTADSCAEMWLV